MVWKAKQEIEQKQNNNKWRTYQKPSQHNTEQNHQTWTQKENSWKIECQKESKLVLKKGDVRKWKIEETPKRECIPKRGWWTKSKETFLKGKKKRKKNRIGKREGFQRQAFRGTNEKRTLKLQEYRFGGFSSKEKEQKQREKKPMHQKQTKSKKNTFLHMLANNPQLLVNFCFFLTYTLLFLQAVFAENTKDSVFRTQLLCITDS